MPGCDHGGNNWMVPLQTETGTQDKRIHHKQPQRLKQLLPQKTRPTYNDDNRHENLYLHAREESGSGKKMRAQ